MWIESLNTLMDDNKILTLASNERIALKNEMRLLFEISHLKSATPATVSRAGILYVNTEDVGWQPFVSSWIETCKRTSKTERQLLSSLFDRYLPSVIKQIEKKVKLITPMTTISMVTLTCNLLDCLLTTKNLPEECPTEWYEIYFVFAVIWGFGSCLYLDQTTDWRNEFSKWWTNEFQTVKFPTNEGNVFNFYVDEQTKEFFSWSHLVPEFQLNSNVPLQSTLVSTSETIRFRFFMDMLVEAKHPMMLVGGKNSIKNFQLTKNKTYIFIIC